MWELEAEVGGGLEELELGQRAKDELEIGLKQRKLESERAVLRQK